GDPTHGTHLEVDDRPVELLLVHQGADRPRIRLHGERGRRVRQGRFDIVANPDVIGHEEDGGHRANDSPTLPPGFSLPAPPHIAACGDSSFFSRPSFVSRYQPSDRATSGWSSSSTSRESSTTACSTSPSTPSSGRLHEGTPKPWSCRSTVREWSAPRRCSRSSSRSCRCLPSRW